MPGSDHVKPATPGVKLTYDGFVLFPDDGMRHELIDGEHYVTPSPVKRRLYGRSDVLEYSIVDPDIEVVRVYRRSGDSFARPIELSREADDVIATDLMPGLALPLARIFRE